MRARSCTIPSMAPSIHCESLLVDAGGSRPSRCRQGARVGPQNGRHQNDPNSAALSMSRCPLRRVVFLSMGLTTLEVTRESQREQCQSSIASRPIVVRFPSAIFCSLSPDKQSGIFGNDSLLHYRESSSREAVFVRCCFGRPRSGCQGS